MKIEFILNQIRINQDGSKVLSLKLSEEMDSHVAWALTKCVGNVKDDGSFWGENTIKNENDFLILKDNLAELAKNMKEKLDNVKDIKLPYSLAF